MQDTLTICFKLTTVFYLLISTFPKIIGIFVFMGYYLYNLHKTTKPARKQAMRLARGTHTPITNLAKITFTGNTVLRAFNYDRTFLDKHISLCHKDILMSQIKRSVMAYNNFRTVFLKSLIMSASFGICLYHRRTVDAVTLVLIMQQIKNMQWNVNKMINMYGRI